MHYGGNDSSAHHEYCYSRAATVPCLNYVELKLISRKGDVSSMNILTYPFRILFWEMTLHENMP